MGHYIVCNDELYHHGVKGMKWGIRRYQNADGSLTNEGKIRQKAIRRVRSAAKTKNDVDSIVDSMSKKDKDKLLVGDDQYLTIEQGEHVVKRFLNKHGDTPISFFDLLEINEPGYETTLNATVGTRSGDEFRGKGYASKCVKKGMTWFEHNKDRLGYTRVQWWARNDNAGSRKLAEKNGFVVDGNTNFEGWTRYVRE